MSGQDYEIIESTGEGFRAYEEIRKWATVHAFAQLSQHIAGNAKMSHGEVTIGANGLPRVIAP